MSVISFGPECYLCLGGQVQDGGKSVTQAFRDLQVWQRSIQSTVSIYRLTQSFPREEVYGLTSQMRRSAVSVASNIAEGQGRLTSGEFKQFLGIARGSNFELQTQLEIARQLGFGHAKSLDESEGLSHEVGKMLYSLLESLKECKEDGSRN
ncbi:MAG: four helix bundle protein [Terracidiphilus sp.]